MRIPGGPPSLENGRNSLPESVQQESDIDRRIETFENLDRARLPKGQIVSTKLEDCEPGNVPEIVRGFSLGKPDAVTREGGEERWGYAIIIVPGLEPQYEKFVYFVYFREGKVVRTVGDISRLNYLHWKR